MADAAALRALAERVEQAEAGSLHLDLAVAQALGVEGDEFGIPEPYSASLDAAVGLVPEGWEWWSYSDGRCLCHSPGGPFIWGEGQGAHATARGAVAAALRARAAMMEGGE